MLVVRVVLTWSPSNAFSLSATSYSLTFAAFGRAFPHDVETTASLRQWILFRLLLLSAAAQAGRHFSPNPRSSLAALPICGDIASAFARSQPHACLPACLLRERERGEATGIKGSSYAAATLTIPLPLNSTIPYCYLAACSRPFCIIAPPTLITRTL